MDYQDINAQTVDKWCEDGWIWGQPITHEKYIEAQNGGWELLLTPNKIMPKEWFGDVKGKKLFGLASGGAQQMPLFVAMGAECSILDYSSKQIEAEIEFAKKEGYEINAIRGDMTKRLPFDDETFDFIFAPVSFCYIEDTKHVFEECYRILKKGGVLACGFDNGLNFILDDEKETVVNTMPFNPLKNDEQMKYSLDIGEGVQFSHSLEEQIGGQLKTGFMITDIYEDTELDGFLFDKNINTYYATRAVKM